MIKQDQGQKLCMQQNLKLQLGVPLKRCSLIIPYKTFTLTRLLFFLNLPNPMLPQFQCLQIKDEALYCFWSLVGLPPVLVLFFAHPPIPRDSYCFLPVPYCFLDICTKMDAFIIASLLFCFACARDIMFGAKGVSTLLKCPDAPPDRGLPWLLRLYGFLCITLLYFEFFINKEVLVSVRKKNLRKDNGKLQLSSTPKTHEETHFRRYL